mgnify:FL=1
MIAIKIIVVLSFIVMIYVNYLANSKPLGGISTGEISNKYNTLFTPSGFTFSIWGIIYLLVFAFVITFVIAKPDASTNMELLGILFIVTCIINIGWLFCWHFDKILLSTIVMILFLLTLLSILQITDPQGIAYATFSVYSGWISVALIANISILLFKYNISIFMRNESLWLFIILFISVVIGGYMVLIQKNYFYGAVFLWAYFGIAMKFKNMKKERIS